MFLCACECSAYRDQKKVLDNLKLELQMLVGVGNKTGVLVSFPGPWYGYQSNVTITKYLQLLSLSTNPFKETGKSLTYIARLRWSRTGEGDWVVW